MSELGHETLHLFYFWQGLKWPLFSWLFGPEARIRPLRDTHFLSAYLSESRLGHDLSCLFTGPQAPRGPGCARWAGKQLCTVQYCTVPPARVLPPRASWSGPYGTGVSHALPSWMSAGPSAPDVHPVLTLVPRALLSASRGSFLPTDFLPRHQKTTTPQTQGQAAALPPPGGHTPVHWELLTQGPSKRQLASCLPLV